MIRERELWHYAELLLPLLKYVLLPAGFGATWFGRRWLLSRSTHWPTTWGTVTGYAPGTEVGTYQQTTLFYSYSVNGQAYSGQMVLPKALPKEEGELWGLPLGSTIEVRYSPTNTAKSLVVIPNHDFLPVS